MITQNSQRPSLTQLDIQIENLPTPTIQQVGFRGAESYILCDPDNTTIFRRKKIPVYNSLWGLWEIKKEGEQAFAKIGDCLVVHVPTGYSVGQLERVQDAKRYLCLLIASEKEVDWDFTETDLRKIPEHIKMTGMGLLKYIKRERLDEEYRDAESTDILERLSWKRWV